MQMTNLFKAGLWLLVTIGLFYMLAWLVCENPIAGDQLDCLWYLKATALLAVIFTGLFMCVSFFFTVGFFNEGLEPEEPEEEE